MEDDTGTTSTPTPSPYARTVPINKNGIIQTVDLDDSRRTLDDLKLIIHHELGYGYSSYDLYYGKFLLREEDTVEGIYMEYSIREGIPLTAVDRVWITVERKEEDDEELWACLEWTVGELKAKLRDQNSCLPSEFEFEHPYGPGKILNNGFTLAEVGVSKVSDKLILIEPGNMA
ncbi:hypothetical protein ACFE04_014665 [Oxalis oulophora]